MSVQIGSIKSFGKTKNFSVNPDERLELIQTVNGAIAVDGWNVPANSRRPTTGDTVSFTATFTGADAATVIGYADSRTKQNVVLENGETITNGRIVIRRITYSDALVWRSQFATLDVEIWKV